VPGLSGGTSTRTVILDNGVLELSVAKGDWPLDRLCGFAARRNPRRGFLIVSKVLGRHIPARPSEMRASLRDLAAKVPGDLPGPTLVVGLAETAVGLGQGLFEELRGRGMEGAFLHSTRQIVDHPLLCRFEEPHSHASAHLLYRPAPETADLAAIRSLLIVDDEVSTGTTLRNLALALAPGLPRCQRIAIATFTDWSSSTLWLEAMPQPAQCVSLLRGRLDWTPAAAPGVATAAFDSAAGALGSLPRPGPFGRVGTVDPAASRLPAGPPLPPGSALRVVGTGEFTHPPFLLAERLEQAGHDVVVQATSRSPVHLGGAIRHALAFEDNYGSGIGNFLYNADPAEARLSLICHETPPGTVDPFLVAALGARTIFFGGEG
jgi:Phosphoribosyl transferase/TRSP domain C terminus to PRTase_2